MGELSYLEPLSDSGWKAEINQKIYRKCQNQTVHAICNWMIPETDSSTFCLSCRLSEIIPNLTVPANIKRWHKIEKAKRRLLYSLIWLELPISDDSSNTATGMMFHLMEDNQHYSEFAASPSENPLVVTGHYNNTITLNVAEADSAVREEIRIRMQERYRTLLGHLRHESGHYYWEKLIKDTNYQANFRRLFGDEREDYQAALKRYYNDGPVENWQSGWVSAYASAHPWEDWAECWAHYLHVIDTLETACDFGGELYSSGCLHQHQRFDRQFLASVNIAQIIEEWSRLSVFINELNRSLGLADPYPFYFTDQLIDKMSFIHNVIIFRN